MMDREEAHALLGEAACREIDGWLDKYPEYGKRSALISALRIVQHQNGGYLTVELMDAVGGYLGLEPAAVYEVATFYSMLETKPVGRHNVSVCTNISCMLCGGEEILDYIERKLGIRSGESTSDGRIYLKQEEECLAACREAPMMMVDHIYYTNLTPGKVDEVLDALE